MEILSIFLLVIGSIVGIMVYAFIEHKRKAKKDNGQAVEATLDDESYIQDIQHLSGKVGFVLWQQYDILLAARPYGWETMIDWANYMESADFDSIDSLVIGAPGEQDIELAHVYNQNKVGLKNFDRLAEEKGLLSIAGHSRTLDDSVKIVWFNQMRVLRVFTHIDDKTLITKYVETAIRRTFGTKDAMRLAKPVPKNDTL